MLSEFEALDLRLFLSVQGVEIDIEIIQGLWTEEQYLKLTDGINVMLEFTDGVIEVLPMSTDNHQVMVALLYELFANWTKPRAGKVRFAPLRVQTSSGKYRLPDILFVLDANDPRRQNRFWLGADLVVEVVSPDKPERDTVTKPQDYAEARIPEYWIVNPLDETITVLTLDGDAYATHGVFGRGDTATSVLLEGFAVAVNEVLDAE